VVEEHGDNELVFELTAADEKIEQPNLPAD
jgi:hypothetical protein